MQLLTVGLTAAVSLKKGLIASLHELSQLDREPGTRLAPNLIFGSSHVVVCINCIHIAVAYFVFIFKLNELQNNQTHLQEKRMKEKLISGQIMINFV